MSSPVSFSAAYRFRKRVALIFVGCTVASLAAAVLIALVVNLAQPKWDADQDQVDMAHMSRVAAHLIETADGAQIEEAAVKAPLGALRDAIPGATRVCVLSQDEGHAWVYRFDLPRDPLATAKVGTACPEAEALGHTLIHEPVVYRHEATGTLWAFGPIQRAAQKPMLVGLAADPPKPVNGFLLGWGLMLPPLLALALAPLLAWLVSRRITAPVDELIAAVRRVKTGGDDAAVDHGRRDELDDLSHIFNDMVLSLRSDLATGLGNARYLEERLAQEMARSLESKEPFSLLMIDIDKLGRINRLFGREIGDRVIRTVGQIISAELRGLDVVARYVDDDFAVLLPKATAEQATGVAHRICDRIDREFGVALTRQQHKDEHEPPTGLTELVVTVSVGVAEFPSDADSAHPLIAAAMLAVRRAKGLTGAMVLTYGSFSDRLGGADPVEVLRAAHVGGLESLIESSKASRPAPTDAAASSSG